MQFELSEEHESMAQTVREVLTRKDATAAARAWSVNDDGAVQTPADHGPGKEIFAALAEVGLTSVMVPEDHDGLGMGHLEAALCLQELGRAAAPGPWVETVMVAPTVACHDTPLYGKLAESTMTTVAAAATAGRALDADAADLVLAVGDGVTEVANDQLGEGLQSIDPTRRLFDLPGAQGHSRVNGDATLAGGLGTAAYLLGLGEAALKLTTGYATERKQFGVAIGTQQAVKHHLSNAQLGLAFARPLIWGACLSADAGAPTKARDIAAAALKAKQAAHDAGRIALQVHGAVGFTEEYDLSLWLLKIIALQSAWGTTDDYRSAVAEFLRNGDEQIPHLAGTW